MLTRPHGPGLSDPGRALACATAVFFIGAGVVHVSAAADHENLPVMLVGFLLVGTLQAAFGALLIWRRPGRLLLAAGGALMLGSVGVWLVSRTAGLPFLPGGHMEPIGFKDGVTVVFEVACVPGLLALASGELDRVALPSPRLGSQLVGAVSTAAFLMFLPAVVLGGGEHHSAAQMAAMGGHSHGEGGHGEGGHGGEQLASAGGAGADHGHGGISGSKAQDAGRAGHGDHGEAGTSQAASGDSASHEHTGSTPAGGDGGRHQHGASGGDREDGSDGHEHRGEEKSVRDRGHSGHGESQAGSGQGAGAHEHGHGGGGTGDGGSGDGSGMPGPDDPGGLSWGAHSFEYEPARKGEDSEVGRGYSFTYKGPPDPNSGTVGHHSEEPCTPTGAQEAAADRLYRATAAAMKRYDNDFGRAVADGFTYTFPLTDRIIHMVHPGRVSDPTILDPAEIESFLYAMTDRGVMSIAGMYIMPKAGMRGPQIGGCRTRWHEHAGVVGLAVSAGTMRRTPEMLHVWTYPGLRPYEHYDSRELSQLWKPGSIIPSLCRETGDASDACIP